MARKSFVILTGAVGAAAVVAGALAARRRRRANAGSPAGQSRPVYGAADNARRFATEWKRDDALADELASVTVEEPAAAR